MIRMMNIRTDEEMTKKKMKIKTINKKQKQQKNKQTNKKPSTFTLADPNRNPSLNPNHDPNCYIRMVTKSKVMDHAR